MEKINNDNEAKKIWESFTKKYSGLAVGIDKKHQENYEGNTKPSDLDKRYSDYVKAQAHIAQWWEKLRSRDTMRLVNPKGNHQGDFVHFINYRKKSNNAVAYSLNKSKRSELLRAVQEGDFSANIYHDKTLPQLALGLYASEQITRQQLFTLIEKHQVKSEYPIKKAYPILNSERQFTQAAATILLPLVNKKQKFLNKMTDDQLESFRILIAQLPKSERFFYTSQTDRVYKNPKNELQKTRPVSKGKSNQDIDRPLKHELEPFKPPKMEQFTKRLINLESLFFDEMSQSLVHLTAGARDALGITRFGLEQYVPPVLRLGRQTINDIEQGVRKGARYAAISYPCTSPYGDELHGWKDISGLQATNHDGYHSNLMSIIPNPLKKAFLKMIDVARRDTNIKWSAEIWDWVDADYMYFFKTYGQAPTIQSSEEATNLFCQMLSFGTDGKEENASLFIKDHPTHLGVLILLDMIKNPTSWQEISIDPCFLTGKYKINYELIKDFYHDHLQNEDNIRLQLIKIKFFLFMHASDIHEQYSYINALVDNQREELLQQLQFFKLEDWNRIYLGASPDAGKKIKKGKRDDILSASLACKLIEADFLKKYPALKTAAQLYRESLLAYQHSPIESEAFALEFDSSNDHYAATFRAKPTLGNWIEANELTFFFLFFLPPAWMIKCVYDIHQAKQNLKSLESSKHSDDSAKPSQLGLFTSSSDRKSNKVAPDILSKQKTNESKSDLNETEAQKELKLSL